MDMEAMMREALGNSMTFEHTDIRSGARALRLSAEAEEAAKRPYQINAIDKRTPIEKLVPAEHMPIYMAVAEAHGVDPKAMMHERREAKAVMARVHFCVEMAQRTTLSKVQIGKLVNTTHCTVIYYGKRWRKLGGNYAEHVGKVKAACS